jgi:CelD/BcsL family acetyltransferase involved in cellulose biosynthesis
MVAAQFLFGRKHPLQCAIASNWFHRRAPLRRIVLARTAAEILSLRSRWEYLQARYSGSIFQSFKWNSLAAHFFEHEEPHVIFCETENGMTILPLCINHRRKSISCLGDVLFDYRDALTIGDEEALLAAWQQASRIDLPFSAGGLQASSNKRWAGFRLNPFYRTPIVKASDISADCFAERHSRSASRLRRLERMGATLRAEIPASPSHLRWIYQQKAIQPPEVGENVFTDPRRIEFMSAVAEHDPHSEDIFALKMAGKCIAALVTLREHRCRRFYTIWFDQQWARYSPGISLIYEVTRLSLAEGLTCDYMTGEQDYKMRFATSVEPLYWIEGSAEELRTLGERREVLAA